MTVALQPTTAVLRFQPQRREHCPDDLGTDDPVYFFGEVACSGCGRLISVSAQYGAVEVGYCFYPDCGTQLSVAVDSRHLRMDDSRPPLSGHGCLCGDQRCRRWEVA